MRVLVVDDHDMFVESLSRLLRDESDIELVAHATSAAHAVAAAALHRPDVAIVDYRLPDGDGLATASNIRRVSPDTQVVMLTGFGDGRLLTAALEAGCVAFVTKDQAVRDLVHAVRFARLGQAYLSHEHLRETMRRFDLSYRPVGWDLTGREQEVLALLALGLPNKQIGRRLGLSVNTIRNHVQNLLLKLGAHSKLEALAIASREGLVRPADGTVGGNDSRSPPAGQ